MLQKASIAVYDPENPLEQAVQDSYHTIAGRWMTMFEIQSFIEAVLAYDGLYEQFLSVPKNVCDDIFRAEDGTRTLYIPCYPLELRGIMRKQTIAAPYKVAAFTNHPAKTLLTQYPVLIALDRERLLKNNESLFEAGGAIVFGNELSLKGCVLRVLSRERGDSEVTGTVAKIVHQECPDATVHAIAEPPGMTAFPSLKAADAVVTVKEAMERTSGKYFEDMKEMGEKPNRVAWMCGRLYGYEYGDGKHDEESKVYFDTGENRYEVKMSGKDDFSNSELKPMVGKAICAKGVVEGYIFTISEYRLDEKRRNDDTVYMHRDPPSDMTTFRIGDRVRHRKRGIAFQQITGEVVKLKGNLMFVKWQGVDDLEVFNLNDTVALHTLLERA